MWYMMNHSSKHFNVRVRFTFEALKPQMHFVACQDIQVGDELQFHYGAPDPAWKDVDYDADHLDRKHVD